MERLQIALPSASPIGLFARASASSHGAWLRETDTSGACWLSSALPRMLPLVIAGTETYGGIYADAVLSSCKAATSPLYVALLSFMPL